MKSKVGPTGDELWLEGRDAANLILSAMIGGYLGLTISREGVPSGSYPSLALLLLSLILFVSTLHATADRLMRELWARGLIYAALMALTFYATLVASNEVGVSPKIVATILSVWVVAFAMELLVQANGWFWAKVVSPNRKADHE